MKFLVLWHFDISRLTAEVVRAIAEQPKYGEKLEKEGKLECRYHVVGSHGGAWIYNVESNEELDRLLAMSPVFNFAAYQVLTLAEMRAPSTVVAQKIIDSWEFLRVGSRSSRRLPHYATRQERCQLGHCEAGSSPASLRLNGPDATSSRIRPGWCRPPFCR
jgi:muconolactone delta-isomerase